MSGISVSASLDADRILVTLLCVCACVCENMFRVLCFAYVFVYWSWLNLGLEVKRKCLLCCLVLFCLFVQLFVLLVHYMLYESPGGNQVDGLPPAASLKTLIS